MSYEKGDPIVRFTDGNWNPASSCFFTEKQCHTTLEKDDVPKALQAHNESSSAAELGCEDSRHE